MIVEVGADARSRPSRTVVYSIRGSLDNPNANVNSPAIGRTTSAASPRVFQLALRYDF